MGAGSATVSVMAGALMVTSSFLPGQGGIESYLAELCELLGEKIAVLAPPERDGKTLPQGLPYRTIPGPNHMLWPGRDVADAIVRHAREMETDKVVFGTPWPLVLLGPQLRDAGLRYSVIVHGAELAVPGAVPVLRKRVARALSHADVLLPVSNYTAGITTRLLQGRGCEVPAVERLRARVDLDRFRPGIDAGALRTRLGLGPKTKVVLCFGRLVPRKGVGRLIEAMPEIAQRVPDTVLVVGGTGPDEKRLRRAAARLSAPVVFAGRVSEEDAPALYSTADVFALPVVDRWFGLEIEGLGVVLLEASACETPSVTGRSGGTPEAVKDGVTGRVIDATDRRRLIGSITELLVDPRLRRTMGAAAREHVAAEFSAAIPPQPLLDWIG